MFPALTSLARSVLSQSSDSQAGNWEAALTTEGWDPMAFVDLCQRCARDEDGTLAQATRRIQWLEMLLLLAHTWSDATGK